MSILIAFPSLPLVAQKAKEKFDVIFSDTELTTDTLVEIANRKQVSGLLVTLKQKMTAEVIAKLPPTVKIIATSSVGFDHFDLAAAKARGIYLTNTPDVLTECTADMALLLLLNACRRGREYQHIMESGWRKTFSQGNMLGIQVSGKTLGIFGMGRIGRAVADRARGFGMKIIYSNRHRLPPDQEKGAQYYADFKSMLPHCDILSLNAPGTAETKHIINQESLALLPKGAVLINVARGSLVDEDALLESLKSGHLFAAGLDVFEKEPDFNLNLLEVPNLFLTPHMASATIETRTAMGLRALENIEAALAGRTPRDLVSQ